jgi:glycosyltransferase involved in cell wall biosynthesis
MEGLTSLVIPAYNVGRRLDYSIPAALAQDYGALEIIVVDDASDDDTADRAEAILSAGGRPYEVIRRRANGGIAAARNTGLRRAAGEFVIFVDADDRIDPDFVSTLAAAVSRDGIDMAFCGTREYFEETGREIINAVRLDTSKIYSGEELAVRRMLRHFGGGVWTTVFKMEFLRRTGLEFPPDCRFAEDTEFTLKTLSRARRVAASGKCPYVYVHNSDNISADAESSRKKRLWRYEEITKGAGRVIEYIRANCDSPLLLSAADDFLEPDYFLRTLTLAARRGDREKFDALLSDPAVRRSLPRTTRYAVRKFDTFAKAMCALAAPDVFFKAQARR